MNADHNYIWRTISRMTHDITHLQLRFASNNLEHMPVSIILPSGFLLRCDPPSINELYRSLRHHLQTECALVVLEQIHVRCQPTILGHLTVTHLQELRLNPSKYSVYLLTLVSFLAPYGTKRFQITNVKTFIDVTANARHLGY